MTSTLLTLPSRRKRCARPLAAGLAALCVAGGWLAARSVEAAQVAAGAEPLRVWTRSSNDGRKTYDAIAAAFTAKTGIRVEYFNATTDFEQRLRAPQWGATCPT